MSRAALLGLFEARISPLTRAATDALIAQATFRSASSGWVGPLSDHFAALLAQVLRTSINPVR